MTAVEYLYKIIHARIHIDKDLSEYLEQAKKMENKTTLRNQLFIGKIHEVLGYDKTIELLKECYKEYPL